MAIQQKPLTDESCLYVVVSLSSSILTEKSEVLSDQVKNIFRRIETFSMLNVVADSPVLSVK